VGYVLRREGEEVVVLSDVLTVMQGDGVRRWKKREEKEEERDEEASDRAHLLNTLQGVFTRSKRPNK
jgi:hypothetical protein